MVTTAYPASDKQIAFLQSLTVQVDAPHAVDALTDRRLTSREASALIGELLELRRNTPRGPAATAENDGQPVTEVGMYRQGEDIFKVQRSQTGNLYAKQLVQIGGERLTEVDEIVNFEFQYAPGAVRALRTGNRMTLDEAKAFGIRYGVCCVCGARLSDATSVANGIGPVCGKRV
jgi:hypothetical protein